METGCWIIVIASYKYLMKEDNQLSKNTYLEREANFDGTILFYHPDGRFVNGWRYDNGKITHRLSPLEKNNPLTKAWVERCYEDCYSYSENICENTTETDAEFGQMPVVECRTEWYDNCYNTCQMEWEDDPHKPGDVEGGYEPGGGSSGGSATPNLNKVSKKNSLNNNDKKKLEEKIEEMRDDCGYQELFNYAEQNGFKINDIKIDPSYKYSGYNPVTNEIVFKSSSEIDNNSFDEEFVHFIQNNMYPGGTSQYVDKGKINLEFEAKIIQDIICGTTSPHVSSGCQYLGGKGEFVSQYAMWIDGIIRTGKFPNYNQIQLEYWTYIEGLKVVPQYNTEVDESIQPLVLNFLNNNACK